MTLEECLQRQPSLAALSRADLDALVRSCEVREHPDGYELIREGDRADAVYFILSGQLRVAVAKPRAADFVFRRQMGPGEIIGLLALIDGGPRSATCTAAGPIRVARLRLDVARLLMNSHAPISCGFQCALATQLVRDARLLNEAVLDAVHTHLCDADDLPAELIR